jgi:hypothetical protein
LLALEARHDQLLLASASALRREQPRHVAHRPVVAALRRAAGEDGNAEAARQALVQIIGFGEPRARCIDREGKIGRRLAPAERGKFEPGIFGEDEELRTAARRLLDPARELALIGREAVEAVERILSGGNGELAGHLGRSPTIILLGGEARVPRCGSDR